MDLSFQFFRSNNDILRVFEKNFCLSTDCDLLERLRRKLIIILPRPESNDWIESVSLKKYARDDGLTLSILYNRSERGTAHFMT